MDIIINDKSKEEKALFKVEKDNEKLGKYLSELIEQKYPSKRQFCKAYIASTGEEPTGANIGNMANRLSQITNGKKAIQTYDLPYFTDLLEVSCEQILSAGEFCSPIAKRVTNYSIASSKDSSEWEAFINHKDKLILNSDEYNKTVIDYALEFGNYPFLKYLMDKKYIWFDSRKDNDYIQTFGAGTSIQRRDIPFVDLDLRCKLATEDTLRTNLIALAADHNDLQMLEELRARENPQLYFKAHYLSGRHPDFDGCYNERMVKHLVSCNENVLDYFTDTFAIRDNVRYKDGSNRTHTFMFPYISKLLDLLISAKSTFTETALKKALAHNKATYEKLASLITAVKNDAYYTQEYMKNRWVNVCKEDIDFYENGNIITFKAFYSVLPTRNHVDGIITNIAQVTQMPPTPILKHLAEELNTSYDAIRNINEHLEEVVS